MYTDHEGNEFETKGAMCRHWKITHCRFNNNLKRGMSLEEALTTPPMSRSEAGKRGRRASSWGEGDENLLGKKRNLSGNRSVKKVTTSTEEEVVGGFCEKYRRAYRG